MAASFQTSVGVAPAPGVAGDFCTVNPRWAFPVAAPGLVAGPNGLTIARFAWVSQYPQDPDGTGIYASNTGSGPPAGFVGRNQQGLIITYMQNSGMFIPAGFECVIYNGGDFWVKNDGTTEALPGMTCYANLADGKASAALNSSTSTVFSIAPQTFSVTGAISGNVLSVSAVGSGQVQPGSALAGTGIPAGLTVVSQLSGTPGGIGTYAVNQSELTIASETITGTWGLLTLGGTVTGQFGNGDTLTGTGVPAGTTVNAGAANGVGLTGAGGAGTYATQTATASTGTITGATNVATGWTIRSTALPGEIMKISDHPI